MSADASGKQLVYVLGLGSNMGPRARMLRAALDELRRAGVDILRQSSVYETEPVGPATGKFLNMVVEARTDMQPHDLLRLCKDIEARLGRRPTVRWGDRPIDIDLLLYSGPEIANGELQLPHPRVCERGFVLVPLAEIAPNLVLPDGRTAAEAAREKGEGVELLGPLDALPEGL